MDIHRIEMKNAAVRIFVRDLNDKPITTLDEVPHGRIEKIDLRTGDKHQFFVQVFPEVPVDHTANVIDYNTLYAYLAEEAATAICHFGDANGFSFDFQYKALPTGPDPIPNSHGLTMRHNGGEFELIAGLFSQMFSDHNSQLAAGIHGRVAQGEIHASVYLNNGLEIRIGNNNHIQHDTCNGAMVFGGYECTVTLGNNSERFQAFKPIGKYINELPEATLSKIIIDAILVNLPWVMHPTGGYKLKFDRQPDIIATQKVLAPQPFNPIE